MRSTPLLAATAFCTLLCALPARASWKISPYDVPGAAFTTFWGLNDAGVAVGQDDAGGFMLDHGSLTSIVAPWTGSSLTIATGISDGGLVVGLYFDGTADRSFMYQGGAYAQFGIAGAVDMSARSISGDGRYVAGTYIDASDVGHGFVLDRTTNDYTTIPMASGQSINAVQGVNDAGQVTGSIAGDHSSFVYDLRTNTETAVAPFPGVSQIRLRAINDVGLLGGWGLDAAGDEVGLIGTPTGGYQTFTFGAGTQTLVYAVNDRGLAVGWYVDVAGTDHAFFASQVPEPASTLLLAVGSGMMAAWRRRRGARLAEALLESSTSR